MWGGLFDLCLSVSLRFATSRVIRYLDCFGVMISLVIALLIVFRFILIADVLFSLLSGGVLAVFGDLWLVWFRYLLAVWCCFWLLL